MSTRTKLALAAAAVAIFVAWNYRDLRDRHLFDQEAKRLCAIDGGLKVFATAKLPAEKFDQYGNPSVPLVEDKQGFGYYIGGSQIRLKTSNSATGPTLDRREQTAIRTADGFVMARLVFYGRSGGNLLDGLVQGGGYQCPKNETTPPISTIFSKE